MRKFTLSQPRASLLTPSLSAAKTFTLKAKQHTKPGPGQPEKQPVLIPLAVGLLGPDGEIMSVWVLGGAYPSSLTLTNLSS